MTHRILNVTIAWLLWIVLIRGDFGVELDTNHVSNVLFLPWGGESSNFQNEHLLDFLGNRCITLLGGKSNDEDESTIEDLLVVQYDQFGGSSIHTQRLQLQVQQHLHQSSEPTVRAIYVFAEHSQFDQKERIRLGWDGRPSLFPPREERRTLVLGGSGEALDVTVHSFTPSDGSDFELQLTFRILQSAETISSTRHGRELRDTSSELSSSHTEDNSSTDDETDEFSSNSSILEYTSQDMLELNFTTSDPLSMYSTGTVEKSTSVSLSSTSDCSILFYECCQDSDCNVAGSDDAVCVNRNCIDDGRPRFTLSWLGDDDLDLYVVTPAGATLSYQHVQDAPSGGVVGEDVEQNSYGYHVENVYFPTTGGPGGTYEYFVRPLTTVGTADTWSLEVHDENGVVASHEGTKFSSTFQYFRSVTPPTSAPTSRPTSAPSKVARTPAPTSTDCDSTLDECCSDSDCSSDGEICFNRNCIDEGNPRVTLSWIGDDDLDLFVETPAGAELSFVNFYDAVSGGRYGEDYEQYGFGYHVESVYFPMSGGPAGNYRFFVRPATTVESEDTWTLTVAENGVNVMTESGQGASSRFYYTKERGDDGPTPLPTKRPTSAPYAGTSAPTETPVSTGLSRAPANPPSRAPQTDSTCSIFYDECCDDSDCSTSRDLCEQRTCIREGNPRISLIWDGDDSLRLFVATPDGAVVSSNYTYDAVSGGMFEADSSTGEYGKHVNNVYFPLLGTPTGTFIYGVLPSSSATATEAWVLEVHEEGELVESQAGTGATFSFEYEREESQEGPERPTPTPSRCSPLSEECCLDSDCEDDGDICVQRTCIGEGSPRITLRWIGDDDLNLFVETPAGTVLSQENTVDSVSSGQFESDSSSSYGFHVETVHFVETSALAGTYTYSVESASTVGIGADVWKVTVYEGGEEVEEYTGIGDSGDYAYVRLFGSGMPVPTPTPAPIASDCSTDLHECCSDSDCASDEVCENRNCLSTGSPRISLSWLGDDDYDLFVRTPAGNTIFYNNRMDATSGGRFEGQKTQTVYGFHAEEVYFPASSSPLGEYAALVRLATRRNTADVWQLKIYENGVQKISRTGTGDSGFIEYSRTTADLETTLSPTPAPFIASASPLSPVTERPPSGTSNGNRDCSYECCSDDDCSGAGDLCVQYTCISDGTPRFTLSWTGNDDLSLAVVTPGGATISGYNPTDSVSGGVFDGNATQTEFGFHVENIVFPSNGSPEGSYSYLVKTDTIRGSSDRWVVRVYVSGELVAWRTGAGASRTYVYGYGSPLPTESPTKAPVTLPDVETRAPASAPTATTCESVSECDTGDVCVQAICIPDGNPRFTVIWTGNDDLDLYVRTPNGDTISKLIPYDEESGGVFSEPGEQDGFGRHVENIYFPIGGGPSGTYLYYVRSSRAQGSNDSWELSVSVDGTEQVSNNGTGDSSIFLYVFEEEFPTATPASPECDTDADCSSSKLCVEGTCIFSGNPRITMTWTGDDDLDLSVITPDGETINYVNPSAVLSTGQFDGEGVQDSFGSHVENIYFPEPGPSGAYLFFARSYQVEGSDDLWNIQVVVDDEELMSESGVGTSGTFSFTFNSGLEPTAAPTVSDCDTSKDECCEDSDCLGAAVCTQRTCINDGTLRFTLTWTGDDDLDIVVVTPVGTYVSFLNEYDETSGGYFGVGGDQYEYGSHVENIFFPYENPLNGTYQYYVRSFLQEGDDDLWSICVHVSSQEMSCTSGTGSSTMLEYSFTGPLVSSSLGEGPTGSPTSLDLESTLSPTCDVDEEECCSDDQCIASVETCVQYQCIDLGSPRFTLTWTGDDDLDLTVKTPVNTTVSFGNQADQASGGIFGEQGNQNSYGAHVENIYFQEGAFAGAYTYSVKSFYQRSGKDKWTVSVYLNNKRVASQTGVGDSIEFVYTYSGSSDYTPMSMLSTTCDSDSVECCLDSDCDIQNELCVQQTCIDRGNPRFTLSWTGDDDLDISVVTPFATTVSGSLRNDTISHGVFGEESDQLEFGRHVENIYFPLTGGPSGTYTYFVSVYDQVGMLDDWTMSVYVDDMVVATQTGTGNSGFMIFDFHEGFTLPPEPLSISSTAASDKTTTNSISVVQCNSDEEICCRDSDCPVDSVCIQRTCVGEGNPRFTLVWNGEDEYNLTVTPPIGNGISPENAVDLVSGGLYNPDMIPAQYGLHVENVNFPMEGGPLGTYYITVGQKEPVETILDQPDSWTLSVNVDGNIVKTYTGSGDSVTSFAYDFVQGSIMEDRTVRACSLEVDECCSEEDCTVSKEETAMNIFEHYQYQCVQRTCVLEGYFQILLSWTGDDDLDLTVVTPEGNEVSYYNPEDEATGGIFHQDAVAALGGFSGFAPHLETVIFEEELSEADLASTTGIFELRVTSFNAVGSDDSWVLQVFQNGTEVLTETGQGDSDWIEIDYFVN